MYYANAITGNGAVQRKLKNRCRKVKTKTNIAREAENKYLAH